jgi:hypothetical protein
MADGPIAAAGDAPACRKELLGLLRAGSPGSPAPAARRIEALIERLEQLQPADLSAQTTQLAGVWELRWSSSSQPYLAVQPWLENLQLLDPAHGRALNLLRLAGPLGPLAGIGVQARIAVEPAAGWGPGWESSGCNCSGRCSRGMPPGLMSPFSMTSCG